MGSTTPEYSWLEQKVLDLENYIPDSVLDTLYDINSTDRWANTIKEYSPTSEDYHRLGTYDLINQLVGKGTGGGIASLGLTGIAGAVSPFYELAQGQFPGMDWWNRMRGGWEATKQRLPFLGKPNQRLHAMHTHMFDPVQQAGRQNLNQTQSQVKSQVMAAADPNRGNVQAPRMSERQIKQEADRTGGTRHAGEMTKAAGRAVPSSHSNVRRYGRADGGMVGLDYLTRRL